MLLEAGDDVKLDGELLVVPLVAIDAVDDDEELTVLELSTAKEDSELNKKLAVALLVDKTDELLKEADIKLVVLLVVEILELIVLDPLKLVDVEVITAMLDVAEDENELDEASVSEVLADDVTTIVDGVNIAADILPEEVEEELLAEDKVLPENRLLSDDIGPLCVEVEGGLVEVVIMLLIENDSIPVVKLPLVDNVELLLEEEIVEPLPADVDELAVVVAELLLVGEIVEFPLVDGMEPLDDVEREVEVEVELLELFAGKVSRSAPHTLVEDSRTPSPFLR